MSFSNNQSETQVQADERRYWVRSGFLTLMERAVGLLFAFGTAVILLRVLSKEDFATFTLFLLITYFVEIGRSGLIQNGLVRFLSTTRDNPDEYASFTTAALVLNLAYSLVAVLLLWLGEQWIIDTWHAPKLAGMFPLYYVIVFIMAFFYHFNFVQQANFEFRGIFWGTFFFRGAKFFWAILCLFAGMAIRLDHLVIAKLVGVSIGCVATWLYASPHLRHALFVNWNRVGDLLRYGKYVLGTNLSTMLAKNIDKLSLGHLLGPAAFAVYDAAGKITQLVEAPSFSIAAVVFPKSAEQMEKDGAVGVGELYVRSVSVILAIILPALILVFAFAKPIIVLFAGPAYVESAGVLRLTVFFGLFMPFAVQFGTILDSTGRPALNFGITLLTAIINFCLSYLFVPLFGLTGAALATLTGYFITFWVMQYLLSRDYGVRWWRAFAYLPHFYRLAFHIVRHRLSIRTT